MRLRQQAKRIHVLARMYQSRAGDDPGEVQKKSGNCALPVEGGAGGSSTDHESGGVLVAPREDAHEPARRRRGRDVLAAPGDLAPRARVADRVEVAVDAPVAERVAARERAGVVEELVAEAGTTASSGGPR